MTTAVSNSRTKLHAKNIDHKKNVVEEIRALSESSHSVILMDYGQVKATDMQDLRQEARQQSVDVLVSKNTVAKIALKESKYKSVLDGLSGQIVLLFSQEEPNTAAKILVKSIKENPNIEVKGLCLGGEMLPASQLKVVADLPTKEEAISMLMSAMNAPVTQVARTLNSFVGGLARCLSQVADQKNAS
ncbi:MAG: 50S ribosomal protein L10 [Candidatus Comchoanobacterales bacterium]